MESKKQKIIKNDAGLLWEQEVAGSNPATPTTFLKIILIPIP